MFEKPSRKSDFISLEQFMKLTQEEKERLITATEKAIAEQFGKHALFMQLAFKEPMMISRN